MKITKKTGKTVVIRQRGDGQMAGITHHPHREAAMAQVEAEYRPMLAQYPEENQRPVVPFPLRWIVVTGATVFESDHQWPPPKESPIVTPNGNPSIITP